MRLKTDSDTLYFLFGLFTIFLGSILAFGFPGFLMGGGFCLIGLSIFSPNLPGEASQPSPSPARQDSRPTDS